MKRSRSTESGDSSQPQHAQQAPLLSSLNAPVSPPQTRKSIVLTRKDRREEKLRSNSSQQQVIHDIAAIEAGQIEVTDHLGILSTSLGRCARPISESPDVPRIPIDEWANLYRRNAHSEGRHFVVHQHDHPVAGPHYDLRLQFSDTSSVSWSIMYGLPGDPNSERLNRNATETRVHCLWNHLIETASTKTGSMIIWDTGEYEILPYNAEYSQPETDDSRSDVSDDSIEPGSRIPDSVKLREAFKNRKIRLRLHGTRLPKDYTVLLRMDKSTNYARPIRRGPKRRRRVLQSTLPAPLPSSSSGGSPSPPPDDRTHSTHPPEQAATRESEADQANHSDDDINLQIQKNNAYPGSYNTIDSIHQRRWYLSLDRESSGFEPKRYLDENKRPKKQWVRSVGAGRRQSGFEPFYVRGPDAEQSVVTGRRGQDVLSDESVRDFMPRKGWRPVLN
ncbi:hypothetical protein N7462_008468 [Penicillium macrosclerotiorum]|uniref:uncharacterized protein n=1 Tax=Penicillium macrosclerotiorum TaxID=303699 RepID=UPI00254836C0|nr:uncharacterized protein N7462_008468 [Penicillium macrosclerotiorum]KAJ5675571.1 hypothetical protein N7462_008468 [Penicillium macrosclerotiorum]